MRRTIVAAIATLSIVLTYPPTPASTAPTPASDPCPARDRHCWEAHKRHQANTRAWWAQRVQQQQRELADRQWQANMHRLAAHLRAQATYQPGQCGGSLPPCWVMMRESRGDIRAQNPRSTASGKWQITDGTWSRHRGYAKARYAPERVQDEKARLLWAGGRGCSHWSACRRR